MGLAGVAPGGRVARGVVSVGRESTLGVETGMTAQTRDNVGDPRTRLVRRHVVAWAVLATIWVATALHYRNAAELPRTVRSFSDFINTGRKHGRILSVERLRRTYVVVAHSDGLSRVMSFKAGPPAAVFATGGQLVDQTSDTVSDERFFETWLVPSAGKRDEHISLDEAWALMTRHGGRT